MVTLYQKNMKHMKIDNHALNEVKEEIKEMLEYDAVVDDLQADEMGVGSLKGSDIIEKGDKKLILEWIGEKRVKFDLVYKATIDTDDPVKYWEKVDGLGDKTKGKEKEADAALVLFNACGQVCGEG